MSPLFVWAVAAMVVAAVALVVFSGPSDHWDDDDYR